MQENMNIKIRVCPNSPCNVTHGLKEFKIHSPKKTRTKWQKICIQKLVLKNLVEAKEKKKTKE